VLHLAPTSDGHCLHTFLPAHPLESDDSRKEEQTFSTNFLVFFYFILSSHSTPFPIIFISIAHHSLNPFAMSELHGYVDLLS